MNSAAANTENHETGKMARIQCYAVAGKGEMPKRFKLILRSGTAYSVPYGLLPICAISHNTRLIIKTYELNITINGRGLGPIHEALNTESLSWVRESPSNIDDFESPVFISTIKTEGEAIDMDFTSKA